MTVDDAGSRRERRPEDYSGRHPATTGLLRFFEHAHLPPHLAAVSRPVGELAFDVVDALPDGPELTTGLRKLLEAKDCFVRCALDAGPEMTRSGPVSPRAGSDRPPFPFAYSTVPLADREPDDDVVDHRREVAELDAAGTPEQTR